jgi:hypothetical protein
VNILKSRLALLLNPKISLLEFRGLQIVLFSNTADLSNYMYRPGTIKITPLTVKKPGHFAAFI